MVTIAVAFLLLFAVIFVVKLGSSTSSAQTVKHEMKKCPQCAELVQPDARICRFCHYEFHLSAVMQDSRDAQMMPSVRLVEIQENRASGAAELAARSAVTAARGVGFVFLGIVLTVVGLIFLIVLFSKIYGY